MLIMIPVEEDRESAAPLSSRAFMQNVTDKQCDQARSQLKADRAIAPLPNFEATPSKLEFCKVIPPLRNHSCPGDSTYIVCSELPYSLDLKGALDYSGTPHGDRKINVHS